MSTVTMSEIPLSAVTPAQHLRQIAAAVRVHFTWWGVHRTLTTQQKEEVGDACGADVRFLTAGKKIIDVRHEAFRRLTSTRHAIVRYWRGLSLPYVEPGVRLIRQSDVEGFVSKMKDFQGDLTFAERELNSVYDQVKADARRRLGKLFNAGDYPSEVRGLFNVEWDFPAVEPPAYLMRLNPELYQQEQDRVASRFEEAVQLAEQAFLTEFARLVSHLTERLSRGPEGERKVFRDSAMTNLSEFFDRFRSLSVRSSVQLDQLVDQAKELVQGIEPQELRESDTLRQQIATQLAGVQSVLDGMLVDRPRRSIVRNRTTQGEA